MLKVGTAVRRYGDLKALDGVSLAPSVGKTTVLIGPSGCGKSTLLRAFIGLVRLDAGEVYFDGELLTPLTELAVRRRVGYVIQQGGLFPHLTARQNVTLAARQFGRTDNAPRVTDLCALTRLDPSILDRYPAELSGGQRQRIGLMRSLMLDPEVLLLDEPLGALDPLVRAELQSDLREIFRKLKKTVVLVTHDLAEAAHFADHLVLMRDGHIEQQGAFGELIDHPATEFVREFVSAQRALHSTEGSV